MISRSIYRFSSEVVRNELLGVNQDSVLSLLRGGGYALILVRLKFSLREITIREKLGKTDSRRFTLSSRSLFLLGFLLFLLLLGPLT